MATFTMKQYIQMKLNCRWTIRSVCDLLNVNKVFAEMYILPQHNADAVLELVAAQQAVIAGSDF